MTTPRQGESPAGRPGLPRSDHQQSDRFFLGLYPRPRTTRKAVL